MFVQPRVRKTAPPPPKKRKVQHTVEEVTFDRTARTEYLTGFHKRKLERKKHAQQIAEQKAREERIEARKQIREGRKQALEEHVNAIQQILREAEAAGTNTGKDGDKEEEWDGLSDDEVVEAPIDMEEEYIDEDKYTTVTVEAVSVDRDGLHKPKLESSDDEAPETEKPENEDTKGAKGSTKRAKEQPKKKKKFRYETKFDRQLEARKQKAKKRKQRGE
ncbi:nucleolar protein 12-domain-containing protein [Apiosordaria backusii]|uniref:Nucleolar protein 12-domain-containing protein n=1 Tax=Apiosordaria backusii TaxID=314023 RepID=A0AA40BS48_9PEZI|nr:nucleolar protein 12-domain-containing protein [Apiosordaria backusii]